LTGQSKAPVSLMRAAGTVSALTAVSRVLGLVRAVREATLIAIASRDSLPASSTAEGRCGSINIFNLGHGVPPSAKLENIASLVETVKTWK